MPRTLGNLSTKVHLQKHQPKIFLVHGHEKVGLNCLSNLASEGNIMIMDSICLLLIKILHIFIIL